MAARHLTHPTRPDVSACGNRFWILDAAGRPSPLTDPSCAEHLHEVDCRQCTASLHFAHTAARCSRAIFEGVDLIQRQQAEIRALRARVAELETEVLGADIARAHAPRTKKTTRAAACDAESGAA